MNEYAILNIPDATIRRFWNKVYVKQNETRSDCWTWTGCKMDGYGKFKWAQGQDLSHRLSWVLCTGIFPGSRKYFYVLHKCDNKACVKPSHLYLGTQQDNADDYKKYKLRLID